MSDSELWWRPVVITDEPSAVSDLLEIVRRRIPLPEGVLLFANQEVDTLLELIQSRAANLCLVDVSAAENRTLALIKGLADQKLTVVALRTQNDSGLILRCIRSGAQEFLNEPYQPKAVWETLDELAARRLKDGQEARGSVRVVFPSKPNLGSTTVATSLALRAQADGRGSVLLADLDPLYGSIKFHLKLKSAYTFLDAFAHWTKLDQGFWENLVVQHAGLDVLTAPEESGRCDFEGPSPVDFLNRVRKYYSHAFLDCPGLVTPWYAQLASAADEVFLVTTNEMTALHATKRSLTILKTAQVDPERVKVIVNRYDAKAGLPKESIETALRKSVFHTLPNDYDAVQNAIFDGRPIKPGSKLGKGLDELWARMSKRPASATTRTSWFSRLGTRRRTPALEITG